MLRKIVWTLVVVLIVGVVLARIFGPRVLLWIERGRWLVASPGIETRVARALGVNGRVEVTAVRIDPRCRIRVVDAHHGIPDGGAQASDVCPPGGAAINANFFDESRNPLGLVLAEGRTISATATYPRSRLQPWGHFLIAGERPVVRAVAATLPERVTQGVQCGPMLVMGGTLNTFPGDLPSAPRAGVGIDARGRVLFAICERSVTMAQWAACLRDQLGCVDALNLDGGPSAQLALTGSRPFLHNGDIVPVFLVAEPLTR